MALAALLVIREGRVLMPLLAGVLFSLALGGTSAWVSKKTHLPYFGVAGLTFATPVMLVGTILVKRLPVDTQAPADHEHRAHAE